MTTKTILAALSGLLPVSAIAGPAPVELQSAPEPEMGWTGFYMGIQGGVNFNGDSDGGLEFDSNLDGNFGDTVPFTGGDAFGENFDHEFDEAGSIGVVIGYDYQINRWVLGGILDYNHTNISENQTGFSATPAFYREERTLDNVSTLRMRAGYLITILFCGVRPVSVFGLFFEGPSHKTRCTVPTIASFFAFANLSTVASKVLPSDDPHRPQRSRSYSAASAQSACSDYSSKALRIRTRCTVPTIASFFAFANLSTVASSL